MQPYSTGIRMNNLPEITAWLSAVNIETHYRLMELNIRIIPGMMHIESCPVKDIPAELMNAHFEIKAVSCSDKNYQQTI
jgi:hypothetical protein